MSPAGKGLTSWLSFVVSNCGFYHFPICILGQEWYLILTIPVLCTLTYFGDCMWLGQTLQYKGLNLSLTVSEVRVLFIVTSQ